MGGKGGPGKVCPLVVSHSDNCNITISDHGQLQNSRIHTCCPLLDKFGVGEGGDNSSGTLSSMSVFLSDDKSSFSSIDF
jgi:hypothetical protein